MAGQPDTPESDIYSLGISLIELLAGKPAFDFSVKTDLVDRIKNGVLDEFPQQTPEDLTAVLKKTIAVEPQDRYGETIPGSTGISSLAGSFLAFAAKLPESFWPDRITQNPDWQSHW